MVKIMYGTDHDEHRHYHTPSVLHGQQWLWSHVMILSCHCQFGGRGRGDDDFHGHDDEDGWPSGVLVLLSWVIMAIPTTGVCVG